MPAVFDESPAGQHPLHKRIPTDLAPAPVFSSSGHDWGGVDLALRRDPFIEQIAALLVGELQRDPHPAQRLITESLSTALAAHLVHRFSFDGRAPAPVAGGLDPRTLRRVIDYMRQNLGNQLSLAALASVAAVSRFHFARLFRRAAGVSPMAYLGKLRLERAQELIRAGELSLVEIADLLGYTDQSHFTRRFRLAVGCTPAVYAREHGAQRRPHP